MNNISAKSMRYRNFKVGILTCVLAFSSLLSSAAPKIETSATGLEVTEETIKNGETLFKAKCQACHQLERRTTGPALAGVTERREMDWLIKWIRNNNELRQSGDADAIAIYNEYNGTAMNVFEDLSDVEIKSILMYTENGPLDQPKATEESAAPVLDEGVFNRTNKILALLALLVFVVIVLIVKTIDIVGKMTGREVIPWNNVNAGLMLLFLIVGMAAGLYELSIHGKYALIWNSSSAHGESIDFMMRTTFIITGIVFFVTQIALFWFAYRYRAKKGQKALYYPENDKLEIVWTLIPAVVLTILVLGGLKAWKQINNPPAEGTATIEVFAQQFAWYVRYPGADGKLGNADYNLISEKSNPLGVAIPYKANEILTELEADLAYYEKAKSELPAKLGDLKATLGGLTGKDLESHEKAINDIESGKEEAYFDLQIRRRNTQIRRIKTSLAGEAKLYVDAANDDIVGDEIHLVVNEPVTMKFRGRDVIHSALMKEFRAQMNVVPGIPTQFTFTPTVTTAEKRAQLDNPEFDYHIICNKICGNSHFNMKIKIVVESQEDYDKWMSDQSATFAQEESTEPATEEISEPAEETESEESGAEEMAMN